MKALALAALLVLAAGTAMAGDPYFLRLNDEIAEAGNTVVFCNRDKRCAQIDFGGKEVVYSGNVPVGESAKIFFDAVSHARSCK